MVFEPMTSVISHLFEAFFILGILGVILLSYKKTWTMEKFMDKFEKAKTKKK